MNAFEQGLLRYLSEEQLAKIQAVRIGLGGAGGLGSNIAHMLVRSGFKHFDLLDKDIVEFSNLNRQLYFREEIGQDKVGALRKRLLKINADLDCKIWKGTWSADAGTDFFKGCDFIVEAFDQAETKKQFVEFYQDKTRYVISGSGMAGTSMEKHLEVKRIGNVFVVGDQSTCITEGHPPLAPRVTLCAAIMAGLILEQTLSLS